MTIYEDLTRRAELLHDASLRCAQNNKPAMMHIWLNKLETIVEKRGKLTPAEAKQKYEPLRA